MLGKYSIQQLILLLPVSIMMILTNAIGYDIPIVDSIAGIAVLCGIALVGLIISKAMSRFIELPFLIYVSVLGLLLASPISPIKNMVIDSTSNIAFLTPTTTLGAFAGISLGKDLKDFVKMGWKYVILTMLVITGTYLGSAIIAHAVMKMTGAI